MLTLLAMADRLEDLLNLLLLPVKRDEAFKNLYFQRNILGTIDDNDKVIFYDVI